MTEPLTSDTLDDFESITKFPIRTFLQDYTDFVDTFYSQITDFFSGNNTIVPTEAFNRLQSLTQRQHDAINVVILNNSTLDNYEFWILTEYLEDIGQSLETANNLSRWLRSAVTQDGYKQQVITEEILSQGQQLEAFERDVIGSTQPQDTWVDTALQNQLREEDYDLTGGQLLSVSFKNSLSLSLDSVVDNIDAPQKTYGLDVNQTLTWESDDLEVLSYDDTLQQSISILASLKRGDDPAFPDRGVNAKVGGNIAGISYPIIFRDMAQVFATDDCFKSFAVTDVSRNQDAVFINYQVQTKAGSFASKNVQV